MAVKVGINGYGRIGRNTLRALYEAKRNGEIQIVALNDLGNANTNAHLTRYDTAHGKFDGTVTVDGDSMVVNGGDWNLEMPGFSKPSSEMSSGTRFLAMLCNSQVCCRRYFIPHTSTQDFNFTPLLVCIEDVTNSRHRRVPY